MLSALLVRRIRTLYKIVVQDRLERVPGGGDPSAELDDVKDALSDLMAAWNADLSSDTEYDSRFRELRSERDRLAALPAPSGGWVDTGKTLGGHWAELDAAGR